MFLSAYDWPQGSTKQVTYINGGGGSSPNSRGHIQELFVGVGGQWSWADLTTISGAPTLANEISGISGYVWPAANTKQVVFSDQNAHIIELFVGVGGQWSWADLTAMTGAPLSDGSRIVGYDWPAGNTKQVVYLDQNHHVIELFVPVGGQWSAADLTAITSAPLPEPEGENIVGYAWSAGNTKQVVYIGEQDRLIELFVGVGGQWSWADLTTITGATLGL